jgi:hypothetical protein
MGVVRDGGKPKTITWYLLLSGNIEINPVQSKCPYGICKRTVASNHWAIQRYDCDDWIHIRWGNITPTVYNRLQPISHFTWICPPCGSINLSKTSINDNDIDISNPYSSLTEELSSDEDGNVFESTMNTTSSEIDEEPPKLQKTHKSIKLMVVNCNILVSNRKQALFSQLIDDHKPDIG